MTPGQILVTILVAIIGSATGTFGFLQFMIKRKDEKEEKDLNKLINKIIEERMQEFIARCGEIGDKQIANAVDKARTEFQEGLEMRRDESTERYLKHSGDIEANTAMIKEVLEIQKQTNEKFDQLAESTRWCCQSAKP